MSKVDVNLNFSKDHLELSSSLLTENEIKVLDRIAFIQDSDVTEKDLELVRSLLFRTGLDWFENFEKLDWGISETDNPYLFNDLWHEWCDAIHPKKETFLRYLAEFNHKLKLRKLSR